jgi:hypothetical protein
MTVYIVFHGTEDSEAVNGVYLWEHEAEAICDSLNRDAKYGYYYIDEYEVET